MKNQNEIEFKCGNLSRRDLLCQKLDFYDITYQELIESNKVELLTYRDNALAGKSNLEANFYLHLRIELEKVLTERIPEEVEDIMVRSNHWGKERVSKNREEFLEEVGYGYAVMEIMYREIYKDDPEFKPELITHTDEELKQYI